MGFFKPNTPKKEDKPTTVADVNPRGLKINYSKLRKSIAVCDAQMRENRINSECRSAFKDLGIEVIDE